MPLIKLSIKIVKKLIIEHEKGITFVIFWFFFLTFSLARLWVYLSIKGLVPNSLIENVDGVHIHHFAYGIIITSIIGYLALVLPQSKLGKWRIRLAIVFGLGLGLTFDEFGMWMHLRDDYWLRQSYDAIILISIVAINIVYLTDFWEELFNKLLKIKSLRRIFNLPT